MITNTMWKNLEESINRRYRKRLASGVYFEKREVESYVGDSNHYGSSSTGGNGNCIGTGLVAKRCNLSTSGTSNPTKTSY